MVARQVFSILCLVSQDCFKRCIYIQHKIACTLHLYVTTVLQYSILIIIIVLTIKLSFKWPQVKTGSPNPIPLALVCLMFHLFTITLWIMTTISVIYSITIIYMIVIWKADEIYIYILSYLRICIFFCCQKDCCPFMAFT